MPTANFQRFAAFGIALFTSLWIANAAQALEVSSAISDQDCAQSYQCPLPAPTILRPKAGKAVPQRGYIAGVSWNRTRVDIYLDGQKLGRATMRENLEGDIGDWYIRLPASARLGRHAVTAVAWTLQEWERSPQSNAISFTVFAPMPLPRPAPLAAAPQPAPVAEPVQPVGAPLSSSVASAKEDAASPVAPLVESAPVPEVVTPMTSAGLPEVVNAPQPTAPLAVDTPVEQSTKVIVEDRQSGAEDQNGWRTLWPEPAIDQQAAVETLPATSPQVDGLALAQERNRQVGLGILAVLAMALVVWYVAAKRGPDIALLRGRDGTAVVVETPQRGISTTTTP